MKYLFLILVFVYAAASFALRPNNVILFSAQANTAGAKNSIVLDAQQIVSGSIQASFTDVAAAGTLLIQCSDDNPAGLLVTSAGQPIPVNWNTLTNATANASAVVAAGATTLISMQWVNCRWLRAQWTRSAGAGTLTVTGQFQAM